MSNRLSLELKVSMFFYGIAEHCHNIQMLLRSMKSVTLGTSALGHHSVFTSSDCMALRVGIRLDGHSVLRLTF